jgi:hypothetical protein
MFVTVLGKTLIFGIVLAMIIPHFSSFV